ncbi:MAG TPA: hypothetical protein VNE82_18145 [Candidatus Binataceae bacterium]|nr:hypothetical protein [Candidatus Binataceae bacterium]
MVDSRMRWPKIIAAQVAAAAIAMAFVAIAFVTTELAIALAIGARAANAAAHSGEPSELAERNVAAMAPPETVTRQMSTVVTGVLAAPAAGSLADHDLHFQGRVSGNIYTLRTQADGAFSIMLPQGVYDLRGMHGAVIVSAVMVGQSPVDLGQVHPPGPYNVWRLIERQEIGEAIVRSPAPATAYLPNLGEAHQPIAVTPMVSPMVMGAGPAGKALAPAEVMPAQIQEQTELPSGAQVPPPGMRPAPEMAPAPGPGGGY